MKIELERAAIQREKRRILSQSDSESDLDEPVGYSHMSMGCHSHTSDRCFAQHEYPNSNAEERSKNLSVFGFLLTGFNSFV